MKKVLGGFVLTLVFVGSSFGQYEGWAHSGSMYILTTPEGANLPPTAREVDFPLLVRLDKDSFDFSQAQDTGADIRFATAAGEAMAYQIEHWDASAGSASIWVLVPCIRGNARQQIKMFWGKADAESESHGSVVFSGANDYLGVWHMNEPIIDAVGRLESADTGTLPAMGVVGEARRFPGGKGITAGENITDFPVSNHPHTSEAWIRSEKANGMILAWGNEQAQGKVTMQFASPPHIRMDCYFSNGNVAGKSELEFSKWYHVVHTYTSGVAKVYVNGVLDGMVESVGSPLNIRTPARLFIGGWYNNYSFVGDIDELRISKVARSADWIRMEYENQRPLQTSVGPLVQAGTDFSVSKEELVIDEGQRAVITARAGGAQKIYWILKRGGEDTRVAVDRYTFVFDADRVAEDTSLTIQFQAIYADEVRTIDIPVIIKDAIPEPVFFLNVPSRWDGRKTVEVVPQISNLTAMQDSGAGDLVYDWTLEGLAVIRKIEPGKLILTRAQNSGELIVRATVSNGGPPVSASASILVKEPEKDAWVERVPALDEKPQDNQFYARNSKNVGLLHCNGTLQQKTDLLYLNVYANDKLVGRTRQRPKSDGAYAFTAKLKPGLVKYTVELVAKTASEEKIIHSATNIVCGDAYIIQGQSNALATDTHEESPREPHEWVRSYANPRFYRKDEVQNLWCSPVWKAKAEHMAELGWWGMELAKRLVEKQKIPIFIVNGAVGGTRIDQHQRNVENPEDLGTIYGRMLWRVRQARLTHGIRGIIWHQGESDQGSDGPDGGYGWETYAHYFVDMSAGWKQDFPNVQHYYLYQIWPNSCSMGNTHGNMLREVQRTLPRLYSNMDVLSTLGIKPPGGCHFPLMGWSEFASMVHPLLERDMYGRSFVSPITPANLVSAAYTGEQRDEIVLVFDQPVIWDDALINDFYLDGAKDKVASGASAGKLVTLKLKDPSQANKITYLNEMSWSQERLLIGENGLAALTFCDVRIEK